MKKLYCLEVKGKNKTWCFNVEINPQYLNEWRADGLIIDELCNIIPIWVVNLGMVKAWCFFQDIFNLKNPFKK